MRMYHMLTAIIMGSILTMMQSAETEATEAGNATSDTGLNYHPAGGRELMLWDFRTMPNVLSWAESSDTVREVGMSKAVLTLQKTKIFQRGIFFTLLNPQENGAGFAGFRTLTNLDLRGYEKFEMLCRGRGDNRHYKIVLRHKGMDRDIDVSYEQFFSVPTTEPGFTTVKLNLTEFLPYFRGRHVDAEPLDISGISMFGIQMYGGVYAPIKQKGVSSLEIDYISATKADEPVVTST